MAEVVQHSMTSHQKPFSFLETHADGRIIAVTQLESGWDGSFHISDDGMSIIKKTKIPSAMLKAKTVLKKHGLDNNNVHAVTLQAAMKKRVKELKDIAKKEGRSTLVREEVLWELPFRVRPKFCDIQGQEANDVMIEGDDSTGVEWAYMFVVGVHAREVEPEAPRIIQNRNRARNQSVSPRGNNNPSRDYPQRDNNPMVEDGSEDEGRAAVRPRLNFWGGN